MRARSTSGSAGRSAAAKRLDEEAVELAVVAHVRLNETGYDELLARGLECRDARDHVREDIDRVLSRWRKAEGDNANDAQAAPSGRRRRIGLFPRVCPELVGQ